MFSRALTNSRGFTLIEMMVVVAIIGILSTLAKFGYDNYQESARQAEAKLTLPELATVAEQFKTEYGSYVGDINALRFIRKGVNFWYNAGFTTGTVCGAPSNGIYGTSTSTYTIPAAGGAGAAGPITGAACTYLASNPKNTFDGTKCTAADQTAALAGAPAADVLSATFTAFVAGIISSGKQCDVWSIDNTGAMVQVKSGK